MKLADLIVPERVIVPIEAATATAAAAALVERLSATGAVQEPERLKSRVAEERGEDIVAMGDRAWVLHYRTDAVHDLVVALGTSPAPIRREGGEGESPAARIVLVILAPPRLAARYLQVLGAFARALSSPTVVDAVLGAPDARALAALPELQAYELPEQLAVRDLMSTAPRTTSPDAPLREAAAEIARAGIAALPVVGANGLLVGMLSERELVRYLASSYLQGGPGSRAPGHGTAGTGGRAVRDVMTRQVLCVSPEQPLTEVASLMVNKDLDGVPVLRDGRIVGFLTRGDIIRKLIGS